MKTIKLFAFAAMALSLSLAACNDDEPAIPGQVIQRGDNACRIETFVLKLSDGEEISCDVYDYDKSIDVSYTTAQFEFMESATAVLTLSPDATVSPSPATAADYTQPVSFTVTAKDGSQRTYTTKPVEKVLETYTKVTAFVEKTATDMGVADLQPYGSIGISGEYLVIGTKVFNAKTLASVGTLNTTGTTGAISWMGNDEVGRLVAAMTSDGNHESVPVNYYCWKNGYNQEPELILGPSDSKIGGFVSVAGNLVEGHGLITAVGGRGDTGAHFCWEFIDGERKNYYAIETKKPSNVGSWSQQVSPCSGDVSGAWFMYNSVAGGNAILTWTNWAAPNSISLISLTGSAINGPDLWGNYTRGSIKAFMFNGMPYALTLTTGWPCTYVAIVGQDNTFLLNSADATLNYDAGYTPIGTYIYNETDQCGYAYVLIPGYIVKCWKLEVAFL